MEEGALMKFRPSGLLLFALAAFAIQSTLAAQLVQTVFPASPPVDRARVGADAATEMKSDEAALPGESRENAAERMLSRPGDWYPFLWTRPFDRQWIKSLPVEERPNRTFHVYGNAVRSGRLPHGPVGQMIFGH
jgi:hypothetical protein